MFERYQTVAQIIAPSSKILMLCFDEFGDSENSRICSWPWKSGHFHASELAVLVLQSCAAF